MSSVDIQEENKNSTEKDYVAISPDGSIAAKFNPDYKGRTSILIKKVYTNDKEIIIDIKKIQPNQNVLEWSFAVSDINENFWFVAISYIIDKNLPIPKPGKSGTLIKTYYNRIYKILGPSILILLSIFFIIPFICIFPFYLCSRLYDRLFPSYNKRIFNNEVFEQFQLSMNPERERKIEIFRFDLTNLESISSSSIEYPFD
ncbi:hypothetical protein GLOIN_2v1469593 [Rhizophagus clarus]|uniref:Uncharacterized protein n=1 Tax=Rhizophagus clarus TaxID=94130 RepID=A0A8H3LGU4_9GLOM|nr:hypothetical protein GLOIN_2v1469593 [Rhizophagus clarus]